MVTLKERLARLEIKHTPVTPISIELHIVEVVALDDERRGTWLVNRESKMPSVVFYATSADEFQDLCKRYKAQSDVLSIEIDTRCINFTIEGKRE